MSQFDMEDLLRRIEAKIDTAEKKNEPKYAYNDDYELDIADDIEDTYNLDEMIKSIDKKIDSLTKTNEESFLKLKEPFDIEEEVVRIDDELEDLANKNLIDKDAKVSVSVSNNDFLTPIKNVVNKLEKENLHVYQTYNKNSYEHDKLTIINYYNAMVRNLEEAKSCIRKFANLEGNIDKTFFLEFVGENEKPKDNLVLNISESDILNINDSLSVEVNSGEVENLSLLDYVSYRDNFEVHYNINYKGNKYRAKLYFENNEPKTRVDFESPVKVYIDNWKKDEKGNMVLTFKVENK